MRITDLKSEGGFVSSKLVAKTIKWDAEDKQHEGEIFVRRVSFGTIDQIMGRDDSDQGMNTALIVETIRLGEKGEEQLTYDQAYQLEPNLAAAMVEALMEVNRIGEQPSKKASARKHVSGTT